MNQIIPGDKALFYTPVSPTGPNRALMPTAASRQ
jgi:hypothetical protein